MATAPIIGVVRDRLLQALLEVGRIEHIAYEPRTSDPSLDLDSECFLNNAIVRKYGCFALSITRAHGAFAAMFTDLQRAMDWLEKPGTDHPQSSM